MAEGNLSTPWEYCWDLQTLSHALRLRIVRLVGLRFAVSGDITRLLGEETEDCLVGCLRLICWEDVARAGDHYQPRAGDQPSKTPAILGRNKPV